MTETTKPPAGGFADASMRRRVQREAVFSSRRNQLSIIRFS